MAFGDREGHAGGPGAGRGDISRGDPRGDRGDTRGGGRGGGSTGGGLGGLFDSKSLSKGLGLAGGVLGGVLGLGPIGAAIGGFGGSALGNALGGVDLGGLSMGGQANRGAMTGGIEGRADRGPLQPVLAAPGTAKAAKAPKLTPPVLGTPPAWMRLDPMMTPLQQRAYIATQGISGNSGIYRSKEAKDYYSALLGNTLIQPTGQLGGLEGILPIEHQYLQQGLGAQYSDTATLLKALGLA